MAKVLKKYQIAITPDISGMKGVGKDMSDEVRPGIESFEQADGKLSGIAGKLGGALVAASAAAAAAFAATAAAIGNCVNEAAQYADEMITQSSITGMSTDALQEYSYMAELVDVSLETITKAQTKNIRSMKAAREGTATAVAAYEALGVAVTDSEGNLRDSNVVFDEAIAALGGVANETERDAIALELFGRSAKELNPMIEQGAEGLAELRNEAHAAGAVLSGEALDQLGAFDDEMQRLDQNTKALSRSVGSQFAPAFTAGLSIINEAMVQMGGDINKLPEVVSTALPQMIALIQENVPMVMELGGQVLGAIVTGVIQAMPQLLETGMQVLTQLITGIAQSLPSLIPTLVQVVLDMVTVFIDNLPLLLDAGLQLLTGLVEGIINAIPVLIQALPKIITSIIDFFVAAIPMIIEAGIQLLLALVENLPVIIEGIVTAIPQIIDALVSFFTGPALPQIIDAGVQLFIALIENLPTIVSTIVGAIPQIVTSIASAIVGSIPQIVEAGVNLLGQLAQNIGAIWSSITSALSSLPGKIVSEIGSWLDQVIQAGYDLISGLAQGIVNGISNVINAIGDAVGGAIDSAKELLGINSPSRVFMKMGSQSGEGWGIGFGDEMESVKDDMSDYLDFSDTTATLPGIPNAEIAKLATENISAISHQVEVSDAQSSTSLLNSINQGLIRLYNKDSNMYVDGTKLVGATFKKTNQVFGKAIAVAGGGF